MSETSLYQDTQLYDMVLGSFASERDLGFYRRQIARYGGPVLELAAGTGRYTVPLAREGIEIVGLDLEPAMLELAAHKAQAAGVQLPLTQGDMRDFDLARTFNVIFIACQSLSHLYERADVEACFAAVRRHLAPEGRFIIELFNPALALLARDPSKRYPVGEGSYPAPDGAGRISVSEQSRYDSAAQVYHITWFYHDEMHYTEQRVQFSMRQFFPQEIDALLAYNGFAIEHKYGSADEIPFTSAAPKQMIICRAVA